jgi:hypothetical protein
MIAFVVFCLNPLFRANFHYLALSSCIDNQKTSNPKNMDKAANFKTNLAIASYPVDRGGNGGGGRGGKIAG